MDSRIEELAQAILERCERVPSVTQSTCGVERGDLYWAYRHVESDARRILKTVDQYRKDHPQEYEDLTTARALARVKELEADVVSLRNELRSYREREKTMGWSQD